MVYQLLKPDTLLIEDAVTGLLSRFSLDPQLGALGPRLLNADKTFQRAAAGAFPTIQNVAYNYLFVSKIFPASWAPAPLFLEKDVHGTIEIDWVSGAAMMVCRKAFGEYAADDPFFGTADDFDIYELSASASA